MKYDFEPHWLNSPGYIQAIVPDNVKEELINTMNGIEDGTIKAEDNRPVGERHLTKETKLPITPKIKEFTEDLCYKYDEVFKGGDHLFWEYFHTSDHHRLKYDTKGLWMNHSYKHDFNPCHRHEGMFAFVIWVKIPYNLDDELARNNGNSSMSSLFTFQWSNAKGMLRTAPLYVDKSWEWNIILFDAFLNHSVLPFYTSDDVRISIAGDIYATMDGWQQ